MNPEPIAGKLRKHNAFPLLSNKQIEQADTAQVFEPGQIVAVRNSGNWSLAMYVQLDNSGCSQGECLITNYATLEQFSLAKSGTADGKNPSLRGIAAATIASQKFGWAYIWGYVEKADTSQTAASGEMLCISGSVAGKMTSDAASSVLNSTIGTVSQMTIPFAIAVARAAFATGVGSVSILGMWG